MSPHLYAEGLHAGSGEQGQAVADVRAPSGARVQPAPESDADAEEGRRLQPSSRCLSGARPRAGILNTTRADIRGLLLVVLIFKASFP